MGKEIPVYVSAETNDKLQTGDASDGLAYIQKTGKFKQCIFIDEDRIAYEMDKGVYSINLSKLKIQNFKPYNDCFGRTAK